MDISLASLYAKADALRRRIDDHSAKGEYQDNVKECINLFELCNQLVDRLGLFSKNESIDDVNTSELKYFLCEYYLGDLMEKRFTSIKERKSFLIKAKVHYMSFMSALESYSLVPPEPKKAVTAEDVRAAKIAEFKLQKTLTTKISELETRLDEEDLREWSLASIELAVLKTRKTLAFIESELGVISTKPRQPAVQREPDLSSDADRLDRIPTSSLPKSGPLLSGGGKVMRPFVLTSKRDQLAQGVFRPDHSLPTMSIDDYLTEEIRRGGIQAPQDDDSKNQGGKVKSGREEEEDEDRETMKKREWDDYVESHAKGSGNMGFNRG